MCRGTMVTAVGHGRGDTNSKAAEDSLPFTYC